jgi:hypothetical protein
MERQDHHRHLKPKSGNGALRCAFAGLKITRADRCNRSTLVLSEVFFNGRQQENNRRSAYSKGSKCGDLTPSAAKASFTFFVICSRGRFCAPVI